MDLNITIDKDSVEKKLTAAILESTLGEKLEKSINEVMEKFNHSYFDNSIKNAVERKVSEIIADEVSKPENLQKIKEFISKNLTDDLIGEIWKTFWDKFSRR